MRRRPDTSLLLWLGSVVALHAYALLLAVGRI